MPKTPNPYAVISDSNGSPTHNSDGGTSPTFVSSSISAHHATRRPSAKFSPAAVHLSTRCSRLSAAHPVFKIFRKANSSSSGRTLYFSSRDKVSLCCERPHSCGPRACMAHRR